MRTFYSTCCLFFIGILFYSCSTPKALEYRDFRNLSIEKLGFSTSTVKMDLIYYNPNNFKLQLRKADLDVFIENNLAGHASEFYQTTIPKKDTIAIPIQFDVDMKNLFRNVFTGLVKKQVLVKVSGTIEVGKANIFVKFPVYYEGTQHYNWFN